jgi:hypothetical protein
MLRQDISIAKCETIISYPFVRLAHENKTFEEFAYQCAMDMGGSPEEWMRKNRKLLGIFGSKHKKLAKNTRFQIPSSLVADASNRFFETVGLVRKNKDIYTSSPTTVVYMPDESSPDSISDTSMADSSPELKGRVSLRYD